MTTEGGEQFGILNAYIGRRTGTMTTLYFTKRFTGGLLKGLVVNESMRFANDALAAEFVKAGRKGFKKVIGSSPYKIVDASYQKYWRY